VNSTTRCKKTDQKEIIYPVLAIIFAASSGYLAFQNHELKSFVHRQRSFPKFGRKQHMMEAFIRQNVKE
jgi:hypothetical protein